MSRILVTGGAGFIGSHLCERLLAQGHEVLCVDNFYTGSRQNVAHLLKEPNFELLRHDVSFPLFVEIDEIYNLACPASPIHYQFDPVQTTKTSVHGAINMLGLAKRRHAKIFQASTSEVYGDPVVHPQTEDYWGNVNPIGLRSCYDEGKRCAETLFFDYHRQHKVKIKVARIFNTYGPRMHPNDGRVVSNFIVQALRNDPISLYGDGSQTRSFCYVDDLVEGFLRLMNTDDSVTGPINLGNPGEFTIRALAERVIALTGSRSELIFQPLPSDDPKQRRPDISKARALLNWSPTIALGEGLIKTIGYFDALLTKDARTPFTERSDRVGPSDISIDERRNTDVAQRPITEAPAPSAGGPEAKRPRLAHMLIIDDNAANRQVVGALCEMSDCTCEYAEEGSAGVEAARSGRFDLVLLDATMPDLDGHEVVRAIRRLSGAAGLTPIIALTENVDATRSDCLAWGINGMVEKPINPSGFRSAIHAALGRSGGSAPVNEGAVKRA